MAEDLQLNEQQQLVLNHTVIQSSSSSSSLSTPSSALFSSEPSIATGEISAPSTTAGLLRLEVHAPAAAGVNRCVSCRKRVGLTGFKCRCGMTFCGTHRHPERHACGFDYKAMGKDQIARANPVVKAEKLRKI